MSSSSAHSLGMWNSARTEGGPGFQTFQCEFRVPSAPQFLGQSFFLWCGAQQAWADGTDFGVLQPVLMFGPDCVEDDNQWAHKNLGPSGDSSYSKAPYWYFSAQYVYPKPSDPQDYECKTGEIFKAVPGELLLSTISYDPAADAMTVQMSDPGRTRLSTLTVQHPFDDPNSSWKTLTGGDDIALVGSIEIPCPNRWLPVPREILQGWTVSAKLTASPKFPALPETAWKLTPKPDSSLAISCTYDPSTLGSECVWAKRP